VAAPRAAGLARLRRAAAFAPFYRAFVAIEFSFLALLAAVYDTASDTLDGTRALVIVLVPVAAIIFLGRLAAILTSARLR
jgi:fatty acid desaturase